MNDTLVIEADADWDALRQRNLRTVLDPMVFRTADLFFAGASATNEGAHRADVWNAIELNIGALMTFVDAALLYDELPIFSYWATFPESRLFELPGVSDMLWPVLVTHDAYDTCKDDALAAISSLDSVRQPVRNDVLGELAAFGYEWQPDTPYQTKDVNDARFFAFVLGGVLFDAFADRITGDNTEAANQAQRVIQPKRARLLAEVATGIRPAAGKDEEAAVFKALGDQVTAAIPTVSRTAFPRAVTFLPLLIDELTADSPHLLLDKLFQYRDKGSVRDYRAWYVDLRAALHKGRFPATLTADLAKIKNIASQEASAPIDFELGLDAMSFPPKPTAQLKAAGTGLIGFTRQHLPGGRHQKLLYRARSAQNRYFDLSQHLRQIWDCG
jgi:hypothetical protein